MRSTRDPDKRRKRSSGSDVKNVVAKQKPYEQRILHYQLDQSHNESWRRTTVEKAALAGQEAAHSNAPAWRQTNVYRDAYLQWCRSATCNSVSNIVEAMNENAVSRCKRNFCRIKCCSTVHMVWASSGKVLGGTIFGKRWFGGFYGPWCGFWPCLKHWRHGRAIKLFEGTWNGTWTVQESCAVEVQG